VSLDTVSESCTASNLNQEKFSDIWMRMIHGLFLVEEGNRNEYVYACEELRTQGL